MSIHSIASCLFNIAQHIALMTHVSKKMMEWMQQQQVQVKEMDGGDFAKVRTEMSKEEIEVHLAEWIGLEYREVQEKIQRNV